MCARKIVSPLNLSTGTHWCPDSDQHQRILSDKRLASKRCLPNVDCGPLGSQRVTGRDSVSHSRFRSVDDIGSKRGRCFHRHTASSECPSTSLCLKPPPSVKVWSPCSLHTGSDCVPGFKRHQTTTTSCNPCNVCQEDYWSLNEWLINTHVGLLRSGCFSCWRQHNTTVSQPISCNECGRCALW